MKPSITLYPENKQQSCQLHGWRAWGRGSVNECRVGSGSTCREYGSTRTQAPLITDD